MVVRHHFEGDVRQRPRDVEGSLTGGPAALVFPSHQKQRLA